MRNSLSAFNFILFFAILVKLCFAGGLTGVGGITLHNLKIGRSNSLNEVTGRLYRVTNNFNNSINLKIYPEAPKKDKLKPGCEIIPDVSWVKIDRNLVTVGPGETFTTDVRIFVPGLNIYNGRKYQFYIVSETVPKGGGLTHGVGLKSRVIFSVAGSTKPEDFWHKLLKLLKLLPL
jgi:hypothetical protein